MKYDDASWHQGENFPRDVGPNAGATHIGMFAAWCALNGLASEEHLDDFADELDQLRAREMTPAEWFMTTCDGKFTDVDLDDAGNAFASVYYAPEAAPFLADYEATVCRGLASHYHVPDTWHTYDLLAPVFDKRYEAWRNFR